MLIVAALVLIGTGIAMPALADIRPPVQGVLADINDSAVHSALALPFANATGSSFILGGQEFFVTSSTRIFDANGKPMMFNELSQCVGSIIRAWSTDVGDFHVADRVDLDAACANSARSGNSTIAGDSGQSTGLAAGGRSISDGNSTAGGSRHRTGQ